MTQSIPPSLPPLASRRHRSAMGLKSAECGLACIFKQSGRHQSSIRFGSWPRNTRNTSLRSSWFAPFDRDDDNAIDRFNTRSHTSPLPPLNLTSPNSPVMNPIICIAPLILLFLMITTVWIRYYRSKWLEMRHLFKQPTNRPAILIWGGGWCYIKNGLVSKYIWINPMQFDFHTVANT